MYKKRNLSQNFLFSRTLVKSLVRSSSIGKNDLVLEIGPGSGIILEELTKQAGHVIGIEIDFELYQNLKNKYSNRKNLTLYLGDALSFPVPREKYKVFSNIPFAIEGELIRKFLNEANAPVDCLLVVRRDLAERLCQKNTLFNIANRPFFEFSIFHYFNKHDFSPSPKVEAVMFRFKKRIEPQIPFEERKKYHMFVKEGFGNGQAVYQNLKKRYGFRLKIAFKRLNISKDTKPSFIPFELWLELYKFLR